MSIDDMIQTANEELKVFREYEAQHRAVAEEVAAELKVFREYEAQHRAEVAAVAAELDRWRM